MTRSLGMLFSVSTSMADISALFVYHIDIRISIRNNYKGLLCTSWESSPGHWGCCYRRPPAWPTYLRRFCIILIEEFQSETTIKLCKGPLVSSAHAQNWRMRSAMVCVISLSNPFIRHSVGWSTQGLGLLPVRATFPLRVTVTSLHTRPDYRGFTELS